MGNLFSTPPLSLAVLAKVPNNIGQVLQVSHIWIDYLRKIVAIFDAKIKDLGPFRWRAR